MSRFSNFTYYIRCNNLDLIEQALTRIFEQEGCRRIPLQERQKAEGRRQKERSINKNFSSGLLPSLKKELYRGA
ncbi:MAG: hypothetical protein V7K27_11425 [Nostoc sp.]|uniref:hypothetical protein n=1 Tax=Nostoc sp. TaxID=1180 RepID=UPI002FF48D7A